MLLHLCLLAAVQGITEFLPISSSGHLALIPLLTGLRDQGLTVDVAAHAGSLGAVIFYFRNEVGKICRGFIDLVRGRHASADARLALCLIAATVPVVIAGALIRIAGFDQELRNLSVIGLATMGFGVLLYWSDNTRPTTRTAEGWTLRHAVIFGLWQMAALIPGASRSGVTITAARLCGYGRKDAVRLAMLMAIPVIGAACVLSLLEVIAAGDGIALREAALVAALSFAFALAALALMIGMLRRFSFAPFVYYRVLLGCVLLAIAWLQ